jgi:hypothetical protein
LGSGLRALGFGVVALGCAGAPRTAPRGEGELLPTLSVKSSAPAEWRYHPRSVARMNVSVSLSTGQQLLAGSRGERWLFDPTTQKLEAAVPAPEDLVAVVTAPAGRWFVGRSGTSYRALTPLGPFVDAVQPLQRLARVSGAGEVLLAVGRDRKLQRSGDGGRTWNAAGPPDVTFVDVAVDREGRALALATPEALFESLDRGATFRRLDVPVRGTTGVATDVTGAFIRVAGVLGELRWVPGAADPLQRGVPGSSDARPSNASPPLGPDAAALAEGRAVLGAASYLELRLVDEQARRYALLSGRFGAPLESRPLPAVDGCRSVRLAAFERHAYIACFRSGPALSQAVEFYASDDGGRVFARAEPTAYAKLADFRMAAGAEGALLVTGVCPPSAESPGCAPSGILTRRRVPPGRPKAAPRAGGKSLPRQAKPTSRAFEFAMSAAPSLVDTALDLAFDVHGRIAFAIGRSSKGANTALFVSSDQGRTFEVSELADSAAENREEEASAGLLTPAADGTMSLVLEERRGGASLLVLDAQGHVVRVSSAPERALIGAAGLSALAVGLESSTVWESLDGGASWEPAGKLPIGMCPGDANCDVPVRCAISGCVIADELSRVGWGTSADAELESMGPQESSSGDSTFQRSLRTPIACTLSPGPWITLSGVRALPGASEAALGSTAWFALADDPTTASATTYHAYGGAKPRVDAVALLRPVTRASEYAFLALPQIEGAAALRYRVPDRRGDNVRLTQIEVAWDNLLEGRVMRGRVADAGNYVPGDFERGAGPAQLARPDLLSIAERGLYLRVHAKGRTSQPTLFLDGKSVLTLPPIPWPGPLSRSGHTEMARLGNSHVGLALLSSSGALVRARQTASGWVFDAGSVGLPDPDAFGMGQVVNITYVGGQAALHVELLELNGRSSEARVSPLLAEGPATGAAQPAPTALDLPARPVACSAALRASSPRLVARGFPGTRHPVIITDAIEPPRAMLSGDAVLHGTRESPCAAAFELNTPSSVPGEPGVVERGILLLDDLEHAWLLKKARDPERAQIQYRSMNCRFEPNLEIPEEIQRAPEALAPKRL